MPPPPPPPPAVLSWFSPQNARSLCELADALSRKRKFVDVPAGSSAEVCEQAARAEPVLTRPEPVHQDNARGRRAVLNSLVKRLGKAQEHLRAETDALEKGFALAQWSDGACTSVHPIQLALQRQMAQYDEDRAAETARACADEYPGSCAAEGAGAADASRAMEDVLAKHPRPLLELVTYDYEDEMLRAPDPEMNEEPCANDELCLGVVLVRDGIVTAPDPPPGIAVHRNASTGFPLVAFYTPQQRDGLRRLSRDGLCLLCQRNRVTATYRLNASGGIPVTRCITPHRVAVRARGGAVPLIAVAGGVRVDVGALVQGAST